MFPQEDWFQDMEPPNQHTDLQSLFGGLPFAKDLPSQSHQVKVKYSLPLPKCFDLANELKVTPPLEENSAALNQGA